MRQPFGVVRRMNRCAADGLYIVVWMHRSAGRFGVGLAMLLLALEESAHSDGQLVGFGLLVELPAIASVALLDRRRGAGALA